MHTRGRSLGGLFVLALMIFVDAPRTGAISITTTWNERGDAGQLPGQSQALVGGGGISVTAISGSLRSPADVVDVYAFSLDPRTFSARLNVFVLGQFLDTASFDTQLFLFGGGRGICGNDDTRRNVFTSTLTASTCGIARNQAGIYHLAISPYNVDPISSGGPIFPDAAFNPDGILGTVRPTESGGAEPVSGWDNLGGGFEQGRYSILLNGALLIAQPSDGDGGPGSGGGPGGGGPGGDGTPPLCGLDEVAVQDGTEFRCVKFGDIKVTTCIPSGPFKNCSAGDLDAIVPEPTTLLLFGMTAAGLGLARWRQQRRKGQPQEGGSSPSGDCRVCRLAPGSVQSNAISSTCPSRLSEQGKRRLLPCDRATMYRPLLRTCHDADSQPSHGSVRGPSLRSEANAPRWFSLQRL